MTSNSPKVSLIMPVFNAEKYLEETTHSILNQTFSNFELIIINDGSVDGSGTILDRYQKVDRRIKVLYQSNQGPAVARNIGCQHALGEYIGLIDADDICLPNRLTRQLSYLDSHEKIGICGSWFRTKGNAREIVVRHPTDDADIRCQMLFDSPFANSTVIMRRGLFHDLGLRYDSTYPLAEDYHFWVSASQYCQMSNLPEILVVYRQHQGQISENKRQSLIKNSGRIRLAQLRKLEIEPTEEEFSLHQAMSIGDIQKNRNFIIHSENWLRRLFHANQLCSAYPEPSFLSLLGERWYYVCVSCSKMGLWIWKTFWNSPLSSGSRGLQKRRLKLAFKCMLGEILRNDQS